MIALLGVSVGLACWPLNGIDRWQDQPINPMPGFSSSPWHRLSLALALAPIPLLPLLLLLLQAEVVWLFWTAPIVNL